MIDFCFISSTPSSVEVLFFLNANLLCFIFTKAEEITLTIGQAFNLAYRKFLESGGNVETRKQIVGLQKRVSKLNLFHIDVM